MTAGQSLNVRLANRNFWLCLALFWGLIGAIVGACLAVFVTTTPHYRRIMLWRCGWWSLLGGLLGSFVSLLIILDCCFNGMRLLTLWPALTTIPVFAMVGCFAGYAHAYDEVAIGEALDRARFHARRFDIAVEGLSLDDQRRALETAAEAKFGSLDDALRERLRTWDEGRLAEARRKLPDAKTAEELD